ncbi:MAG TPA: T9SS type A sorting domain-containing protein, partial [Chitinophagales bacterium]|nr:T9SS type A sorting domain-containing protein [Chitinophagales bacterium]
LRKIYRMKKDTPSLQKKLKSYSVMAGSMLTISQLADAQIIHNNITDTTFIDNETGLSFDLNNDGTTDYTFFLIKSGSSPSVNNLVDGFGSNVNYEIAGSVGAGSYIYPIALASGEKIDSNLEWHGYGSLFWVFGQHYSSGAGTPLQHGNWLGQTDKFAGLRIELDGHKYYGWARMSVDSLANQFTFKDYAMQSIADSSIIAGDTDIISGVHQFIVDNHINIIAFEKNVFITVPGNAGEDLVVTVVNVLGGIVQRTRTKEKQVHLQLTELPDGIYLVAVETQGTVKTKKISIK